MSAGNAHKIYSLKLKYAQELIKMSYEKPILLLLLYIASLNPYAFNICPQTFLSYRKIALYFMFPVLLQQGLIAAG